jgi:hypothetical protein
MDSIDERERIHDARRRLRAQRERAGQLRGRVVAISLIGFVLLWGVVFVQMATGNDPVLGDSSPRVATSGRNGTRNRNQSKPKETPTETEVEPAFAEPEPVEAEIVEPEPEPEPEPAPVITSQS